MENQKIINYTLGETFKPFMPYWLKCIYLVELIILFVISNSVSSSPNPVPRGVSVQISATELKIFSEIKLKIGSPTMTATGGLVRMPFKAEYYLPADSEIIFMSTGSAIKEKDHIVLSWRGTYMNPHSRSITCPLFIVRFRITKKGFYKLHGKLLLDKSKTSGFGEFCLDEAKYASERNGKGGEIFFRQALVDNLAFPEESIEQFKPAVYYIRVTKNGGRVETWNFGSPWRILLHHCGRVVNYMMNKFAEFVYWWART